MINHIHSFKINPATFQNRKVDHALLQRAWQTAHQVATMLYEDFGATQVAVFGSRGKMIYQRLFSETRLNHITMENSWRLTLKRKIMKLMSMVQ